MITIITHTDENNNPYCFNIAVGKGETKREIQLSLKEYNSLKHIIAQELFNALVLEIEEITSELDTP